MGRLDGIIFDLDGTLGETLPVCFAAFRRAFQIHLGRTYTNSEIRALFGPSEEGVIAALAVTQLDACYADYLNLYEQEHARCPRPFAGIPELLERLRKSDVRLAIVTGKGQRSAAISLRVMGLDGVFDPIEAGSRDGAVKPEKMRRVIEVWDVPPENVLSVGDAPSDIRSAKWIGAIAAGAAWSSESEAPSLAREEPEVLFHQVSELARWLDENYGV